MSFGGVIQRGGDGLLDFYHIVMAETIQLIGGDTGLDVGGDVIEDFRGQAASDAHFFDIGGSLESDGSGHG